MKFAEKRNVLAFILLLPILAFHANHFFHHDPQLTPTGFVTAEHATYMVYAKQYVTGDASLLFSYPFQPDTSSPRIFFQPQTLVLGYLWKWTGMDPGLLLTMFGLVFSFLAIRAAYDIIKRISEKHAVSTTALFIWGGGILVLSGILLHVVLTGSLHGVTDNLFRLDPGNGWWCLYVGRALVYPLEAYYHFLFLWTILMVLQRSFVKAAVLLFILTLSHSYTSVELSLILLTWLLLEKYYLRHAFVQGRGFAVLLGSCVFTFLFFAVLTLQPLYRDIFRMVALDWGYKAWNFIPAYALVWLATAYVLRTPALLPLSVADPARRLFLAWGLVAFALSVHNFAIKPIQPLHFTRGYVYAGFFLFAAINLGPQLASWRWGRAGAALLLVLCFLDNSVWFAQQYKKNAVGAYLTTGDRQLIHFLDSVPPGYLINNRTEDAELALFIQLYTPHKVSSPHPFLTIHGQKDAQTGTPADSISGISGLPVLLLRKTQERLPAGCQQVFNNGTYMLARCAGLQ